MSSSRFFNVEFVQNATSQGNEHVKSIFNRKLTRNRAIQFVNAGFHSGSAMAALSFLLVSDPNPPMDTNSPYAAGSWVPPNEIATDPFSCQNIMLNTLNPQLAILTKGAIQNYSLRFNILCMWDHQEFSEIQSSLHVRSPENSTILWVVSRLAG